MNTEIGNMFEPESTEEVRAGLIRAWYMDRQIVSYKLTSVSQAVVDALAATAIETLEAWPKDRPYLAMHDLSKPGISLHYASLVAFDTMNIGVTAAGRRKSELLFAEHADWTARVAISFNLSVSGHVNKVLVDGNRGLHPSIKYKAFYNQKKSLQWLAEPLIGEAKAESDDD